ncbi:transposase InsO family protein [Rhodanobacter sp. ANJX3]|nr:transposase InsO family protein [Rhodanobacter sp. ANJX3]
MGLRGTTFRWHLVKGLEFIRAALRQWALHHGVELLHIQPGKPNQNAYIERFIQATLIAIQRCRVLSHPFGWPLCGLYLQRPAGCCWPISDLRPGLFAAVIGRKVSRWF